MPYDLEFYFIVFLFYSVVGWLMEVILKLLVEKKLINRGFLMGPYCPIYGFGALLITLLLGPFQNNVIVLFFIAILICSTLEYFTSFIMEKFFHARWWDYSQKKYNLNGRICLDTTIPFGILGCLVIYLINPSLIDLGNDISKISLQLLIGGSILIISVDFIISLALMSKLKSAFQLMNYDNTTEINAKIKELLSNMNFSTKRLVNAYPNFRNKIKEKIRNDLNELEDLFNK